MGWFRKVNTATVFNKWTGNARKSTTVILWASRHNVNLFMQITLKWNLPRHDWPVNFAVRRCTTSQQWIISGLSNSKKTLERINEHSALEPRRCWVQRLPYVLTMKDQLASECQRRVRQITGFSARYLANPSLTSLPLVEATVTTSPYHKANRASLYAPKSPLFLFSVRLLNCYIRKGNNVYLLRKRTWENYYGVERGLNFT